ncbi:MAG: NAD(P)H-dependent oxidoreductase [Pseudomonadota bacterium]
MSKTPFTILEVTASARTDGSVSRALVADVTEQLSAAHPGAEVIRRDVAAGVPLIDEAWVGATFTPPENRTADQHAALSYSDRLVEEVQRADAIVIGTPIYNFSVPAALKAWIDQIARARLTFEYTPVGPRGLLADRPVYLVIASGGTGLGSEADFASGYLKHFLAFLGITSVKVIAADQLMAGDPAAKTEAAKASIETLL